MRVSVPRCIGVSLAVFGVAILGAQVPRPPSLILHNARIYTSDARHSIAEAVAITGDRIVRVGSESEILGLKGPSTRLVDAGGATIVPGLHDAHAHVVGLGAALQDVDLRGTRSFEEVVGRVRRRVATARPGEWIVGRGWDQNDWPDTNWPTNDLLSAATPDNPVYLTRVDGHAGLANRKAIEAASLGPSTADPPGGRIMRTSDGQPTGVVIDGAQGLITSRIPRVGRAQLEEQIQLADREMRRVGITTVHDAGADGDTVEAYKRLIEAGAIKTRLYVMLRGSLRELTPFFERGPVVDFANHRMAVRAVKIYADGALGSRGAALLEPYSDEPATSGLLTTPPDEVYSQAIAAARAGFQV